WLYIPLQILFLFVHFHGEHDEKPLSCAVCNSSFSSISHLLLYHTSVSKTLLYQMLSHFLPMTLYRVLLIARINACDSWLLKHALDIPQVETNYFASVVGSCPLFRHPFYPSDHSLQSYHEFHSPTNVNPSLSLYMDPSLRCVYCP